MTTIVSVTPIAVHRDSRTFKQAASMARLGYRSIVVEGERSPAAGTALPFQLVSPARAAVGPAPAPDAGPTAAPSRLRRPSAPVLGLASQVRAYAVRCRSVAAALPPADLYYLHSPLLFPAVRTRRTPFVYDAHDLYWELRRDGRDLPAATRGMWAIWDRVERACAARAQACVTVGTGVARLSEERFGRPFAVVRNAHDPRLDAPGGAGLRERLGLAGTDFVVAVSGNYKRGLAVAPMLDGIDGLPGRVHLVFIGAGYEPFAGRSDRAHFLPPVAPTEIVPLLAGADVAAVPYLPSSTTVRHALPNGFFHAVAAGLPVLYSRLLVDLRELAAAHRLGWEIDPGSPDSIAAAVRTVLEDPDGLAAARTRLQQAREELSWAHEECELQRVIVSALQCHTRTR